MSEPWEGLPSLLDRAGLRRSPEESVATLVTVTAVLWILALLFVRPRSADRTCCCCRLRAAAARTRVCGLRAVSPEAPDRTIHSSSWKSRCVCWEADCVSAWVCAKPCNGNRRDARSRALRIFTPYRADQHRCERYDALDDLGERLSEQRVADDVARDTRARSGRRRSGPSAWSIWRTLSKNAGGCTAKSARSRPRAAPVRWSCCFCRSVSERSSASISPRWATHCSLRIQAISRSASSSFSRYSARLRLTAS